MTVLILGTDVAFPSSGAEMKETIVIGRRNLSMAYPALKVTLASREMIEKADTHTSGAGILLALHGSWTKGYLERLTFYFLWTATTMHASRTPASEVQRLTPVMLRGKNLCDEKGGEL